MKPAAFYFFPYHITCNRMKSRTSYFLPYRITCWRNTHAATKKLFKKWQLCCDYSGKYHSHLKLHPPRYMKVPLAFAPLWKSAMLCELCVGGRMTRHRPAPGQYPQGTCCAAATSPWAHRLPGPSQRGDEPLTRGCSDTGTRSGHDKSVISTRSTALLKV